MSLADHALCKHSQSDVSFPLTDLVLRSVPGFHVQYLEEPIHTLLGRSGLESRDVASGHWGWGVCGFDVVPVVYISLSVHLG